MKRSIKQIAFVIGISCCTSNSNLYADWGTFKANDITPSKKHLIDNWEEDKRTREGDQQMIYFKRKDEGVFKDKYKFEFKYKAQNEFKNILGANFHEILHVDETFAFPWLRTFLPMDLLFRAYISRNIDWIKQFLPSYLNRTSYCNGAEIKVDDKVLDVLQNFARLQQSDVYKIHLQINKKFLFNFVVRLFEWFENNKILQNISSFKFTADIDDKRHGAIDWNNVNAVKAVPIKAVPIIVVYLPENYLPEEKERFDYLDSFINAFIQLVDSFCHDNNVKIEDIVYPVTPRFNYKINDVVYIAGGDADYKLPFLKSLGENAVEEFKTKHSIENKFYSNDLCFIKGFEYKWDPTRILKQSLAGLKESLTNLKIKLHALNEKLAAIKAKLKLK
jgi:hypothetical protein